MDIAKRRRSQALSNFTRNVNSFNNLVKNSAPSSIVKPQFDKVLNCWDTLEKAQDSFIELTNIDDIDEDEVDLAFLDEPGERRDTVLTVYSDFLKEVDKTERSSEKKKSEDDKLLEDERRKREVQEAREAREAEEVLRKFESVKAEFTTTVDSFERLDIGFKGSLGGASEHGHKK